jgi:hypothetical protein
MCFRFSWLALIAALAVMAAVYSMTRSDPIEINNYISTNGLVCFFVFIAAFAYEIISLVILDRLGYEEARIGRSGMIMRTYGLMGLGSAMSLWILSFVDNYFKSATVTVLLCIGFSIAILSKRNLKVRTELSPQIEL